MCANSTADSGRQASVHHVDSRRYEHALPDSLVLPVETVDYFAELLRVAGLPTGRATNDAIRQMLFVVRESRRESVAETLDRPRRATVCRAREHV